MHAAAPEASRDPRADAPAAGDGAGSSARRQEVARALAALLPADCLLSREEELRPYECDGLAAYRQPPLLVALPRTESQVCDVVRTCHRLGVPLVARGAGTGLSGGALPHAAGVLLSLARFDRILNLDPLARTARVQPGVRNLAVSEAAAPFGLYYAPDPPRSSRAPSAATWRRTPAACTA